ncbi:Uncharacterized protein HZ326_7613 [Fusarium oxysporum f. sp. albedinis]|nr:Uncharacterized protein HZ326_7613 [Fusarium oxysporum f. sp. albedinis]
MDLHTPGIRSPIARTKPCQEFVSEKTAGGNCYETRGFSRSVGWCSSWVACESYQPLIRTPDRPFFKSLDRGGLLSSISWVSGLRAICVQGL